MSAERRQPSVPDLDGFDDLPQTPTAGIGRKIDAVASAVGDIRQAVHFLASEEMRELRKDVRRLSESNVTLQAQLTTLALVAKILGAIIAASAVLGPVVSKLLK